MTVKIRIPSSEASDATRPGDVSQRPGSGPVSLISAGLLAVSVSIIAVISAVSGVEPPDSSVPAPFEPNVGDPLVPDEPPAWTDRTLPGSGWVLAVGTVGEDGVAVVQGHGSTLVWRLVDDVWHLDGSPGFETLESAVVMDDRVLLVARLEGRPTVWEWVDGSARYLFQPASGFVAGAWSVGGRLVVSVAPTTPGIEQTIRLGRRDALWIESTDGEFEELQLAEIESVLAVGNDAGSIVVGGRSAVGRAAVGVVEGGRVEARPVPGAPQLSAVTAFAGELASRVVHVSVANRGRGTHDEIRLIGRDGELVAGALDLVGISVVDDVVVGVTQDGAVVRYRLDGEALPAPPSPPWSYGFVRGLALVDGRPLAFGQSESGAPMLWGPSAASAEVMIPTDRWERYHSEASDGFRLFHVGSLEFATRDTELFHRSWNADRWHRVESEGELVIHGTPRVVELDWGFVLIPAAGGGLWSSVDGATWMMIEGSESVRISEVATNGTVLVGMTHLGALGGPTSDVTVLDDDRQLIRYALQNHVVGLMWDDGVGFAGSVVPPGSGYVSSSDGIEWTQHDGLERFDWVVAFDGALYLGTGEPVIEGDPPAETPGGEGWLFSMGETPAFQSGTGSLWLHTGASWVDAGFGATGGLPVRPHTVIVRGSRVFAMIEGIDGAAETYVLELD